MMRSDPPRLATYLLERMTESSQESIIGDLVEQYRNGRSRAWYWRQALIAIVASTVHGARTHKGVAVAILLMGGALLATFVTVFEVVRTQLQVGGLIDVRFWWWRQFGSPPEGALWSVRVAWVGIGAASSGWLVTRLSRTHWPGAVLAFLMCYLVVVAWSTGSIVASVLRDPHVYRPAEWFELARQSLTALILCPACILLGALWAMSQISDYEIESQVREN